MNTALIFRLLSWITGIMTLGFGISLGVGFLEPGEAEGALRGLEGSMLISAGLGVFFYALSKRTEQGEAFFRKEALCVVGLGWLLAVFLGALPYFFGLKDCGFADAFFESASGLTTTGSSVFKNPERLPQSLFFWRALTQWIGGLGVVVFFVALLSSLGAGAKILYSNEASVRSTEIEYERVSSGALRILMLYGGLSLMAFIALYDAGLNGFQALCTTFCAVSTGGFGLGFDFSPAVEWILILVMILGGTSFIILLRLLRGEWASFWDQTETLAYVGLLGVFTLLTAFFIYPQLHALEPCLRKAGFQVVSFLTTTGFTSADYGQWVPGAQALLMIALTIGGCTGSTSGGLKVVRFVVALRLTLTRIESSFRHHVVSPIRINGQPLDLESQNSMMAYIVMFGLITGLGCVAVAVMEPRLDLLSSSSAVLASICNAGPGLGQVGPVYDWSFLHAYTKVFLALIMILGRLEFYALLVLMLPRFWSRFD